MLIRLCGHFINNPNHIDKLICIKGLPDDFFFRQNVKYEGKELIPPWEPDVEINIHPSVRHLCDPVEVIKIFPPIEKGKDSVVDRFKILGVRFNFISESGQTMWEKIERYLERAVPRDQLVPKPVLVAPDQKSDFNPHEGRRSVRGSLELRPAEVPVIDLRPPEPTQTLSISTTPAVTIVVPPVVEPPKIVEPPKEKIVTEESLRCDQCPKEFTKVRALRMHKIAAHKKIKEPVGV